MRYMRMLAACMLCVAVADCDTPQKDKFSKEKAFIADQMKDPASVQFRNVERIGSAVCGLVNAKNAYGGYIGYKKFAVFQNANRITDYYLEREPDRSQIFDQSATANNMLLDSKCR